jgi:antitoxin component of MazEF toxin-antitoxin module
MPKRVIDSKLRKVGNSYVVTIPSNIIKKFKLKPKKFITLTLEESEK